jgi:hypothetical protein
MTSVESPRIENIRWGEMRMARLGEGKDMKLWPGGGRAWDWTETGTHHDPGIQIADVEELVEHGAEVIVLSRGMNLRLKTRPETLAYLDERGITYHVEETTKAAELYNRLAESGASVGGLFHSTC